jgi:hypothetical protein
LLAGYPRTALGALPRAPREDNERWAGTRREAARREGVERAKEYGDGRESERERERNGLAARCGEGAASVRRWAVHQRGRRGARIGAALYILSATV